MNSKLTDEQLIGFLYGELSIEESQEVENYLEQHPEEKARLEMLNQTRLMMNELGDEELQESIVIAPYTAQNSTSYWRPFIGVAASLLLIMTFGWLTGFGISNDQNGFRMGYQEVQYGLTANEVSQLIENEREQSMEEFKAIVTKGQDSLYNDIRMVEASINDQPTLLYQQEKQDLMDDMLDLSDGLSENYREVMRQIIVNFSNNWQNQRIQDLQNIQAAFGDLEDATINNQLDIEDELIRLSDKLDAVIANLNNNN